MGSQGHDAQRASEEGTATLPLALIPAVAFALLLYALATVPLPSVVNWSWIPSLGINFALRVDGLSAQFLLLITGIGALVFVYASGDLGKTPKRWRVFMLLSLFMFSIVGAVVSDNLIVFSSSGNLPVCSPFFWWVLITRRTPIENPCCKPCW